MKKKLFGTDGIRGIANSGNMTPEMAVRVGKAVAHVLRNGKKRPKVLLGKDTRVSCYMIENALTSGLLSMGADVLLVGPMPSPAISHLVRSFAVDIGIMVSASHNPYDHNGIKLFSKEGIKLKEETELKIEKYILNGVDNKHVRGEDVGRAKRIDDAAGRYIEFVKSAINNFSLKGLKVVIDCANGAAYHIAPAVFAELGAETIMIHNHPNGLNINKDCGSEHPQSMVKAVKQYKADCGICFDGDADRILMVDEKGNEVDGDFLTALIAIELKKQNKLKRNTVVGTIVTNKGIENSLKEYDIGMKRVPVGDHNIVDLMLEQDYNFGGEQTGHIILGDYSTTADATITGLFILKIMKENNKKLSELAKALKPMPQVTINVPVKQKRPIKQLKNVTKKADYYKDILKDNGRVIVRYSGTEMKARVIVEGKSEKEIKKIAKSIANEIKKAVG